MWVVENKDLSFKFLIYAVNITQQVPLNKMYLIMAAQET
jgi:hypothetical protein